MATSMFGRMRPLRRAHAHGDVRLEFPFQALTDLTRRDELPFAAGERGRIHLEVHREGGFVHFEHGERFGALRVGDGRADRELFDAVHEHDVARFRFVDQHAVEPFELQDLIDLRALRGVLGAVHDGDLHVRTDAPAVDAPDADLADVGGVVKRADLELQGAIRIVVTHGNVLQDRVEDGAHVADRLQFFNVGRLTRVAREGRGVDHGEVQLVFRRAQLVEEVERLVHHPVRTRARTVDLVDDDDGLEALGERLSGHEARLRHRTFDGVDQEQHAVHHRQHALHLTAEVRMPRGVDDVDVGTLILDGAVLRENRDAAFAFKVVRVHHAFGHLLVGAEGAGALKEPVDHGRLAVVDVRDDRNVTNGSGHGLKKVFWVWSVQCAMRRSGARRPSVSCAVPRRPPSAS